MAMKTWTIDLYYGIHPLIVAKRKVQVWRDLLSENGFTIKSFGADPHKFRITWNVTHHTNEYALEQFLFQYGDTLLPVKCKEIENAV
jgi:hypothetical protein